MKIEEITKEIKQQNTPKTTKELIAQLQKELDLLKDVKNKVVIAHQLSDLLILIIKIAIKEGIDLDEELKGELETK